MCVRTSDPAPRSCHVHDTPSSLSVTTYRAEVNIAVNAPKLVFGDHSQGVGYRSTAVGASYTNGGMYPCVTKDSVTVTGISFTKSDGLVLTG